MDLKASLVGLLVAVASVPVYADTDWNRVEQQFRNDRAVWEQSNRWNQANTNSYSARSSITRVQYNTLSNDVAVVVNRQPRYSTVYQQVCTQVPVERRSQGGGAVGAILGAAIGNQIGDGRGRDIATAAGAVIGGQMGSQNDGTTVDMQTRCSQQPSQVVTGEIITFEYRGRRFTQLFNN
jgi:uncharacterized protein YcfJ